MIPNRRFRPEPMTTLEAIEWLKTHRYVWYQAPMDHSPRRLFTSSKVKTWKRAPERFQVSVELPLEFGAGNRPDILLLNEEHLDRLRMPFELWHHGVKATVSHVNYVGSPHRIVLHQSNGFHLDMNSLDHAMHFARTKHMELTVVRGKRTRVLVPACEPISGERNF